MAPQRIHPSTVAFAVAIIAIGLWGFAQAAFVAIWAPGVHAGAWRSMVALSYSLMSLLAGAGLLWPRSASIAARVLLAFLVGWLVWCKGVALVHAPAELASWESLAETAVIVSAAWAIATDLDEDRVEHRLTNSYAGNGFRILYGLSLIGFGLSHLGYLSLTASLVPGWLPWHSAWVYFTAATYLAAGLALVAGRYAYLAATLSALQMALFGVLVWLPKIIAGARDPDTLNEAAISFTLAVGGWVIATAINRSVKFDRSSVEAS